MFYARRYSRYRLGRAFSQDGHYWSRDDTAFPFIGEEQEWEAREQTYPSFFSVKGETYMLYNGAGYGRSGFGLAILT